jgi:hypothetical protein
MSDLVDSSCKCNATTRYIKKPKIPQKMATLKLKQTEFLIDWHLASFIPHKEQRLGFISHIIHCLTLGALCYLQ